jgi:hypothetical protein
MDKIENSSTNTYLSKMQLLFPYHRMTKQTDRGEIEGSFTQNLAATRWYIYITDRQLLFAAINMVLKTHSSYSKKLKAGILVHGAINMHY